MSIRKKKLLALALSFIMLLGLMAGCGGGETPATSTPPAEENTGDAPEAEPSDEPVEEPAGEPQAGEDEFYQLIAGKGEGLKVGITVAEFMSTFIVAGAEYNKRLLEDAGAEVMLVNADNSASTQSSQIDDFISMECDVIIIHATDSEALAPAIQKAAEAGVVVMGFNKEIAGGHMDLTVAASDNTDTGEKAAKWLAAKAAEEGVENPKVAVMQGTMSQSDAYLRQDGIEKVEGLELINNPCEWSSDKAESMLSDVLTANPDLYGIITQCDSMDAGVISALRQADRAKGVGEEDHIYWVGIDCDPIGIDSLNNGLMDVAIEQSPLSIAVVITKAVLEYVAGGETIGGEMIMLDTKEVYSDETEDPELWALYDINSDGYWVKSKAIWERYL